MHLSSTDKMKTSKYPVFVNAFQALASLSKFVRRVFSLLDSHPFTLRSLIVIFGSLYILANFAVEDSDIVAYMLGGGALALAMIVFLTGLVFRFSFRKSLRAEVFFETSAAVSQLPVKTIVSLTNGSIPPFFSVTIQKTFAHPGTVTSLHLLRGKEDGSGKRLLTDHVVFPHRGLWKTEQIKFMLADSFGFFRFRWNLPVSATVEVSAPIIPIMPLPVLTASAHAGDEEQITRERTGDPFDIKAYDPSDGITRILWKTYAKSNQLVVRRPEPALIPEGEVAIYLVAAAQDDGVAGSFLHYLSTLEQAEISVAFGTDGTDESDSSELPHRSFYTETSEIRHSLNLSVWSSAAGTGNGFAAYIESLSAAKKNLHQIIVFCPSRDPIWAESFSRIAGSKQLKLFFAIVPPVAGSVRDSEKQLVAKSPWRFGKRNSDLVQDQDQLLLRKTCNRLEGPASSVVICQYAGFTQ